MTCPHIGPDPAKVDEYMQAAEKLLKAADDMKVTRPEADLCKDLARVWLDMARLQHERVRDHQDPKEGQ